MVNFWEENENEQSATRLVFLVGSAYSMAMGAWVFAATHDFGATIATVTALAGVFGLQKYLSKQEETKQIGK